jgi:hypothetical protein
MIDMTNLEQVRALKSNLHATFDSSQGKEAMKFMKDISGWFPTVFDSNETNDIIARDANRRLLGTIRTILELSPEQLVALAQKDS